MRVKIAIQTTSTKCQYRAQMSISRASFVVKPRFESMANIVSSQSTPAVTCAPWKPVSVKKVEPNRLRRIDNPSCTNDVNSYAWKPRKVAPAIAVAISQKRELPRMELAYFGLPLFSTASSASTMKSDDISRTNVDIEVTGMFRIGFIDAAVWCAAVSPAQNPMVLVVAHHHSCGKGPTRLRPL